MMVSLVVAVAENGVIGRDGGLPWRLSSDLKTFRRLTMGKPLIMGRRTFQSLRKPLDGRDNIVVSRDAAFQPEGAIVARDLAAALERARACAIARGVDEIMVIGGSDVFKEALPFARFIYKTEVHGRPEGDALFPDVDWSQWEERRREPLEKGERDDFAATFVVLERKDGRQNGGRRAPDPA
jgi:dihydrofolate reductase